MGLIDKFRNGGMPRLPPREEQVEAQQTQPSSASVMSGETANEHSAAGAKRTEYDERLHRSMLYLNLPTATEREALRRKEEERQAREKDKKESKFRKKMREITNVSAMGGGTAL